jgi:hypothetical protein
MATLGAGLTASVSRATIYLHLGVRANRRSRRDTIGFPKSVMPLRSAGGQQACAIFPVRQEP